jgi:hypothetical protein
MGEAVEQCGGHLGVTEDAWPNPIRRWHRAGREGLVQAFDLEPVTGALLTIGSAVWSVADKRGR